MQEKVSDRHTDGWRIAQPAADCNSDLLTSLRGENFLTYMFLLNWSCDRIVLTFDSTERRRKRRETGGVGGRRAAG